MALGAPALLCRLPQRCRTRLRKTLPNRKSYRGNLFDQLFKNAAEKFYTNWERFLPN
jgi:hypothetical protein